MTTTTTVLLFLLLSAFCLNCLFLWSYCNLGQSPKVNFQKLLEFDILQAGCPSCQSSFVKHSTLIQKRLFSFEKSKTGFWVGFHISRFDKHALSVPLTATVEQLAVVSAMSNIVKTYFYCYSLLHEQQDMSQFALILWYILPWKGKNQLSWIFMKSRCSAKKVIIMIII